MKMLTWRIGAVTRFLKNPGKNGKYFKRYLEPEIWNQLLLTYADGSYERTWDALFAMCDLFRQSALVIAERYGFDYPTGDDERVSTHLCHVRALPRDAKEIY